MRRVLAVFPVLAMVAGCPPQVPGPLEPIALNETVAKVNTNAAKIAGCLKAIGPRRGHFTDDAGTRHPFDLEASMQVLAPRYMYATFKSGLGTEEMLLGSNADKYWIYIKRDADTYRQGSYAALEDTATASTPLRPDMIIEALGFASLPNNTLGTSGPVQRIVDEYQQLIFLAYTSKGQAVIRKEYWLDRLEPRLIRRIVFRDEMGRALMDSALSGYKAIDGGGALLPHRIRVEWPLDGGTLDFQVRRWRPMPDRTPDHPAFIAPPDRGQPYPTMIDLDTGLPLR